MSTSPHSPTDLRVHQRTETPQTIVTETNTISRAVRRPVRGDGFGHRFPVLFDHLESIPTRDLAHWGPGARYMMETFLTVVILLTVAAIAIVWYLA